MRRWTWGVKYISCRCLGVDEDECDLSLTLRVKE